MTYGMGTERAEKAHKFLCDLFPRWKTTPALNAEWVELLARFQPDVVSVVLKAHRRERKGNDPSLGDVQRQLEAAARQAQVRQDTQAPATRAVCPEGLSDAEVAAWILDHGSVQSERHRGELVRVASGQAPEGECYAAVCRGEGLAGIVKALGEFKGSGLKRTRREQDAADEQARQAVHRNLQRIAAINRGEPVERGAHP